MHRGSLWKCRKEKRADLGQPGRRAHFLGLPSPRGRRSPGASPEPLVDGHLRGLSVGSRALGERTAPGLPRGPRSPSRTAQLRGPFVNLQALRRQTPMSPLECPRVRPASGGKLPGEVPQPGCAPPQPGPNLPGPQLARLQGSVAGVYSARAPHTHHPGLRRLTHVSRRLLKQTRRAARAAEPQEAPGGFKRRCSLPP